MNAIQPRNADRIKAAVAAGALQALIGYGLIVGWAGDLPTKMSADLKLFGLVSTPAPPVAKVVAHLARAPRRAGAASPPNLEAKATDIAAPQPVVLPLLPPPIIAALVSGIGNDPSAGAAQAPGPGAGSGGQGTGTGSGAAGNGDGGGGGTHARWLRGRIKWSDYPREAEDAGIQGSLVARYVIDRDGRVADCTVIQSSGSAQLDETTCRLVRERFRYSPARDAQGHRTSDVVIEDHHWVLD